MSSETDGCCRPNDNNEPKGCSDAFLQQHADANRKSLASWYNSVYLPSNKKILSRQANQEMNSILSHVLGQHPLTRSDLGPESLAIVSEWEKLPLIPGTANFQHARIRLIKNMATQGILDHETITSLQITPAELNEARIWLSESTQGEIVAHYPYRQPFYYKELDTDGQTTLPPWPYAQYAEPEKGNQSVSDLRRLSRRAFRNFTARGRQSYQAKHPSCHHPYARPGVLGRNTRYYGELLCLGVSSSSGRDQRAGPTREMTAYGDDLNAITNVPLPIETGFTATETQPASEVAEEQAVEGTTYTFPDPIRSSSTSRHEQNTSHGHNHDIEEHEQAVMPLASAHIFDKKIKTEESDDDEVDGIFYDCHEQVTYQDGFVFIS